MRRRGRGARALAVLLTALVLPVAAPPGPAHAVARSTLQNNLDAAAYDYRAARQLWARFPAYDWRVWAGKSSTATRYLAAAQARLDAARTQSEIDAVADRVFTERRRARVFRVATVLAERSFSARGTAVRAGQDGFTQRLEGTLDEAGWAELRSDAAAVSALAATDRRRAWAALLTTSTPAPSAAAAALGTLTSAERATAPSGWVGVPGGCAVRAGDAGLLGRATEPGVHLWVGQGHVDAARARSAETEGLAATAHQRMLASADAQRGPITSDLTMVSTPLPLRVQRLGYAWLVNQDADAAAWLRDDLQQVLLPGPKAANVLRDGVSLESLATSLDWLGLDEDLSAESATLREALLVRWLGPLSCRVENLDSTVTGTTNIPIAVNTAMLHAAYALAPSEPRIAAGLVRAAQGLLLPAVATMTQDGGSFEGPSYWNLQARYLAAVYGTTATVYAGLDTPWTLPSPGGHPAYAWSSTDARGASLPFSDAYPTFERLRPGLVSWMAHRTGEARAGALMRAWLTTPTEAWQVLWWPTEAALQAETPERQSRLFSRTGLAALQAGDVTAWLKGGSTRESHTHLDLGMVGYSRYGIHWAVDPGKGDYSLPQYSSRTATSKRWTYWKVSAAGHSTLSPAAGQPPLRVAPFSAFAASSTTASAGSGTATVDLRQVLPGATSATRTASLAADGTMTVIDRVSSSTALSWVWRWVTDADVAVTGTGPTRLVTLSRSGQAVRIALNGLPAGSTVSVVAGPTDAVGPDGRQLRVVTVVLGRTTRLALSARVL